MESINIEQTKYTPGILMDIDKGLIEIKGDSLPENTREFYSKFMETVEEYLQNPQETTTVNLELTYFNSSSSKLFYDFFDILDDANDSCNIVVNWLYDEENESMEEAGEDYKDDFDDLEFNMVVI